MAAKSTQDNDNTLEKLFNQKIINIDSKLDHVLTQVLLEVKNVSDKVESVEKSIDKVNNSLKLKIQDVNELTNKTNREIVNKIDKQDKKIEDLKLANADHVINCPTTKELLLVKEDLMEYRFFKKYPNMSIVHFVIYGVLTIGLILAKMDII